ncbi:hypothetical protein AB0I66_00250 [Streptomyces sp. NPDC050439]|uniref:hypothetical protein n=1 Tax=unclassified Streptomyces TaxID=2593676 RepID=UPI003446A76F
MTRAAHQRAYFDVRTRKKAQSITLVLALCTAGVLTSCTSGDSDTDSNKDSAPPSTSAAMDTPAMSVDPQAKDKQAVLEVYKRMWEEQVKAYAAADLKGTELKKYATASAYSRAKFDVEGLQRKGIFAKGKPGHETKVTSTDLERQVPRAELTDCLDTSTWKYFYRKTGKPVPLPEGNLSRYVTTVKAEKWGKKWMVLEIEPEQRAC